MLAVALRTLDPAGRWRSEEYEFVTDRPAIDLLTGGPELRETIDADDSLEDLLARESRGAAEFDSERRAAWLYEK
jgi:hypothetical protein